MKKPKFKLFHTDTMSKPNTIKHGALNTLIFFLLRITILLFLQHPLSTLPFPVIQITLYVFVLIVSAMALIINVINMGTIFGKSQYSSNDYLAFLKVLFDLVFIFAYVYFTIYSFESSSFAGDGISDGSLGFDFLYFSVVTLTTLGYGDIYPVSVLARSFVIFEVLLFAVYISIILLSLNKRSNNYIKGQENMHDQVIQEKVNDRKENPKA